MSKDYQFFKFQVQVSSLFHLYSTLKSKQVLHQSASQRQTNVYTHTSMCIVYMYIDVVGINQD